jgi:hypothetical protein
MGGIGSGVKRRRKIAVEECLSISVATHLGNGSIARPGDTSSGLWRRHDKRGDAMGVVGYVAHLYADEGWLRLFYAARGKVIDRVIQLRTSRPNYGGLRWWFVCPVTGKWTTKLYLLPGGSVWVSREGGGLTYLSCRESGRYRTLFARLATRMGTDQETVRAAIGARRGR